MTLPRAAQIQAEQAEELRKSMYETPETPAQDAQDDQHADEETETDNLPKATAPDPEPEGHAEQQEESIEERYRKLDSAHKTLQGKYRAEVPRLQDQVRNLTAQLDEAKRSQASAEKTAEKAKAELSAVSDRLKEEIGEEAADALNTYTDAMIKSKLDSFQEDQQRQSEKQTADRFFSTLYSRVPDFDQVNVSPEFVKWLNTTTDPDTGLPFYDTLNKAGSVFDVITVIDITKQFKREQQQPKRKPSDSLSDHVAPARTASRQPVKEKPTYTANDYVQLQDEIRRGLWKGREAEARQIEKEIHAALTGS